MRVSVTGATGFIGNHVVKELLEKNFEVNVIARNKEKAESFDWYKSVNFIQFKIEDLTDLSIKLISNCDKLIHLAWDGLPNYKNLMHFEKNLMPQYFFLKKMVEVGVKDISVSGTCLEYGNASGCLSENAIPDPRNPYATAKDSLRRFLVELQKTNSYHLKWIRLFYTYGEGQSPSSLISQLDKALKNGDSTFNMSGGEQVRDFLPVKEVAENIVNITMQNKVTGIINCCSNEPITVKHFVENYLKQNQQHIHLNLGYYPYTDYEPMFFWGDNSKLKSITNGYDS